MLNIDFFLSDINKDWDPKIADYNLLKDLQRLYKINIKNIWYKVLIICFNKAKHENKYMILQEWQKILSICCTFFRFDKYWAQLMPCMIQFEVRQMTVKAKQNVKNLNKTLAAWTICLFVNLNFV